MSAEQTGADIQSFLNHEASGGGSSRMTVFRKLKKEGECTIWLCRNMPPQPRWAHRWPRFVPIKDRESGVERVEVWSNDWICHEREAVLQKQNYRDEHDSRELPPEVCPLDLMIEWVRARVATGDLQLWQPIFRYRGSEDKYTVTLTAGGIYNAFKTEGRGALKPAVIAKCRDNGIVFKEAWKENSKAKCGYVFAIVDDDDVEAGLQIAIETEALGNKMQRAIRDEIDRRGGGEKGRARGNPLRNPYPFKWQYRENMTFDEKYRVIAMTDGEPPLTPEIEALINEPAPDIHWHMKPGNIRLLRADMEKSALVDMPFDEFFEEAERRAEQRGDDGDDGEDDGAMERKPITNAREQDAGDMPSERQRAPQTRMPEVTNRRPSPQKAAEEEPVACDYCEREMSATASTCPHCGVRYDAKGKLLTMPCLKCNAQITLDGDRCICEKCGTIHEINDAGTWSVVQPAEPAAAPQAARRRTRSEALHNEDDIPFGRGARR